MRALPLALAVCAVCLSACGAKPECSPTTCATGCCDAVGECQSGFEPTACGSAAGVCQACLLGQSCFAGLCLSNGSGGYSGTGGFSGEGGGHSGGAGGGGSSEGGGAGGGVSGEGGGSTGGFSGEGGGSAGGSAGGRSGGAGGGGSTTVCDSSGTLAADFAHAMGVCSNLVSATFVSGAAAARAIRPSLGTGFLPRQGSTMVHLSTGKAVDLVGQPTYFTQPGEDFGLTGTQDPAVYKKAGCAPAPTNTPPTAHDKTELKLVLTVPAGARQLSFQYNFLTAEFPVYRCTAYTDRFTAALTMQGVTTNLALDSFGEPITASSNSLSICSSFSGANADNTPINYVCTQPVSGLAQSGYGVTAVGSVNPDGAATGWLTATAPVTAGQSITLSFVVLDEGDGQLDSAVLLDNLRFE